MTKQLSILVAEDEEADVFLLQHAMRKTGSPHKLVVARDGKEAVEYLSSSTARNDLERHALPELVLLDIKMPRMTGFEVLAWLKDRPELKDLPAVVLTSSADEADQTRARELGAVDYRIKPADVQDLVKVMQDLQTKWLDRSVEG